MKKYMGQITENLVIMIIASGTNKKKKNISIQSGKKTSRTEASNEFTGTTSFKDILYHLCTHDKKKKEAEAYAERTM